MSKVLAIDYGAARVGVAVSDDEGVHAFSRPAIKNTGRHALVQALRHVIDQEQVSLLVAGLPLSMDGSEGPQAKTVRTAVDELARTLQIPVQYEDERLTSSLADRFIGASTDQDSRAAAAILETYLERIKGRT